MIEKLKTLKDFKYNPEDLGKYSIVSREWLKAEAIIPRIKWYQKQKDKNYSEQWNIIYHRLIQEFMEFGNITSEDLK